MFQTKINNSGLIPKQISFRTMRKKNKIINGYAIFYFYTLPPSRNQRYPALPSISGFRPYLSGTALCYISHNPVKAVCSPFEQEQMKKFLLSEYIFCPIDVLPSEI